jgi:hypothetical protein
MKRITDASAPTRGRVELLTGPDDRPLLTEVIRPGQVDNVARPIEYMNAQWHAMGSSPMPPTGIRVVDEDNEVVILSRGPIAIGLVAGGFRRHGRVLIDNPKCEACLEGKHRPDPVWHTWADGMLLSEVPDVAVTQRCSCACAGPRVLTLVAEEV